MPALAANLPPRRTTLESADVAHVQLPRDLLRAPPCPSTRAYAAGRDLELEPNLDSNACARLLACTFALLARYAQQQELAFDVALHLGELRDARGGRVQCAPAGGSFADLSAALADQLAALPSLRVRDVSRRSNVAVTLLGARAKLTLDELPSAHDLHFIFHEQPSGVALLVAYAYGAFKASSIERMIDAFALSLQVAKQDLTLAVRALPALSHDEARAVAERGRGPAAREEAEPVALRFQRVARAFAHATALRFRGQHMSYGELDARSDQLARYLIEAGASTVAVCLSPSLDVLVALIACLKAGAVYVPLDPSYPSTLLELMVDEVGAQLALTDQTVDKLPAALPRLVMDRDFQACVIDADRPLPLPQIALEQDAYVLYTSGTTGRPKGVLATQRNLAHYLDVARERFAFDASDVFCSLARYTFSISFFELLSPLLVGAELHLLTREDVLDPARLIPVLQKVTVLHAGPSLLTSVLRHTRAAFSNVRHASSGGDLVGPDVVEQMKRAFPTAELFVIYGCTEIACMGTAHAIVRAEKAVGHLVGKPFPDVTVRVLDEHGRTVPFGVVGEIYFAGKGVARRYLHRAELSSQRFVCIDGQRLYRTGDLGRLHEEGGLEILGRSDFQVQVRGMRIELAGIEATLRERGLAHQCAVIASARDAYDVRLVAFVVEPSCADLRSALAAYLPDYMIPQTVIPLDALPLTRNGKLDRARLAELALTAPRSGVRTRPESGSEIAVAEAFAEVLGVSDVGLEDDFFSLGGHSLSAVLLLDALQARLGVRASLGTLFSHSTVRAMAAALQAEPESERARPVLLNASPEAPALFLLLGVHLYRDLARSLEGQFAVYGVYADSELALIDDPRRAPSVAEFARAYVAAIRERQPEGPYRVGGMSFGGIVAYEVAQQLRSAGEQVELLMMFDAILPMTRIQKLARALGTPWRVGSRKHEASFVRYQDQAALNTLEVRRQRAYERSARRYLREVRPYDGPTTLVVAGARLRRDPWADASCGFARLVPTLRVRTVDCEHLALMEGHGVGELLLADLRSQSGRRCVPPPVKLELVRAGA